MMKNFDLDSSSLDLALIAKGKHRGKPWDKKRGKFQAKQKGMANSDTYVKRNVECDYCGKSRHLVKKKN
jgi:DNA-directed RNA polymerase subunit RPC12/RpoP